MLVLSRRIGESIQIGDNITITVTQVEKSQIKIGIEAPRDVPILRSELKKYPELRKGFEDAPA